MRRGCGIGIEFGWFGFGGSLDLFPHIRLGVIQVYVHGGSLLDHAQKWNRALRAAEDALKQGVRGSPR